jgi:hypothetical protein
MFEICHYLSLQYIYKKFLTKLPFCWAASTAQPRLRPRADRFLRAVDDLRHRHPRPLGVHTASHHPLVLCRGRDGGGGRGGIQRRAVREMGACSVLELRGSNNIGAWGCGLTVSTTMMLAAGSSASRSSQIVGPITELPAELDSKKKRIARLQSNRNWHARRLHAGAQSMGGRRREQVRLRAAPRQGGRGSGCGCCQRTRDIPAGVMAMGQGGLTCASLIPGIRREACACPLRCRTPTSMRHSGEAIDSEKGGRRVIRSRNFYKCIEGCNGIS